MSIDAHQHFWQPKRGDYGWIPEDNETLNRAYSPMDLAPELAATNVQGTVLVQAAPTVHETEYLLGLADATDTIKGVVGWIDFENPAHLTHLTRLARHPKFLGVRPMIQDIPDPNWMLRNDIQWAFESLNELDLSFDALGFSQHIPNFLTLMKRYPDMRVVYDHCMKPQLRDQQAGKDAFTPWADGISKLAEETTGYCKLSGLITEADEGWNLELVKPFSDHVIKSFGSARVMWGSDWPVCKLKLSYQEWYNAANTLTESFSDADRTNLFTESATRFYRLL